MSGTAPGNDLRRRFEEKTTPEPNTGCLLWTAGTNGRGYGRLCVNGRVMLAHRVAWVLAGRELRRGVNLLHVCDNTFCVEARHLFEGTQLDNMHDMATKGRGSTGRSGLPRGVYRSDNRFVARYYFNGNSHILGRYGTAEEAGRVALEFNLARAKGLHMSVFHFLLRCHDHLLACRDFALKDRHDGCMIFMRLAMSTAPGKEMVRP